MDYMSFELYCVEVENIPYYNFLGGEEREIIQERYEAYCEGRGIAYD